MYKKLVIFTNSKSHTIFRLVPKSVHDLECPLNGVMAVILRYTLNASHLKANYTKFRKHQNCMFAIKM